METTLKDLAVKHDYYCHDNNFYSNDARTEWDTWKDFYEHSKDMDEDMNLIFRWDISKDDEDGTFSMKVYIMRQRKGIFAPQEINLVEEDDVPTIIELMNRHWAKLNSIWAPISKPA